MKIELEIKAFPGDRVEVENYNLRPKRWEDGKISDVSVTVRRDGNHHVSYCVDLARISKKGRYIHVTVGADKIR